MRKGMVVTGAVLFGVFYLGSILIGAGDIDSERAPYGALFVPVIGPFIVAGAGNFGSNVSIDPLSSSQTAYIFDGLIQTGGAALLLFGIFAKKKVFMREDVTATLKPDFFVGPRSVGMKMHF